MKALLLHLSDLHLKSTGNHVLQKLPKITDAIRNEETDLEALVVVLSGDVANTGSAEEYAVAYSAIRQLLDELNQAIKVSVIKFVVVPGNHDCDLTKATALRDTIIAAVRGGITNAIDAATVAACCNVQDGYFRFQTQFPEATPGWESNRMFWDHQLSVGPFKIGIRCFNTAWFSQRKEQQGTLFFPEAIDGVPIPDITADYVVSVFHHPYNWMPAGAARRFRGAVEQSSDLILTGHEHEPDHYQKYTFRGEVNEYLEGAVLQDHSESHRSGFHAIIIDLKTQQERVISFAWEDGYYVPASLERKWRPYKRGERVGRKAFELKDEHSAWLEEPGATYKHPSKLALSLTDIFVFPNVRELKLNKKNELVNGSVIEGRDLLKHIGAQERLTFLGRQHSGKTSLAKILYKDYHNRGLTPVLISADTITSSHLSVDSLETQLESIFQEQYRGEIAKFRQADRDSIVIMVDDFDHSKLNSKGRLKLLSLLGARYSRIVIFGDEVFKFEEMVGGRESAAILDKFCQLEILQFGHLLRSKLIEQWYSIGLEYVSNIEEQARKQHQAELLITTLLGKNYLPSFPVYILTLLQASGSTQQLNTNVGTYGGLYEVLITEALAKGSAAGNLDLKHTYLSELSYYLFCNSRRKITEEEWNDFHSAYCEKYRISPSREGLLAEFKSSGLIEVRDNERSFRHAYAYYYFVARYFRDNLSQELTKKTVASLCDNLHLEEQASIWLFLTHLSRDPFIVEVILAHAKKIFSKLTPARFEEDVRFLALMSENVEKISLEEFTTAAAKEERLREMDKAAERPDSLALGQVGDTCDEANEALKWLAQLTMALRTLEVLGQLVKNFPGSLIGEDKSALVRQCYELGLRTISMLFDMFQANADEFTRFVVEYVWAEHPDLVKKHKKSELEAKVKTALFALVESCAFGIVKRTSQAVGHSQLGATYAEVLREMDSNASRLVDISIELDNIGLPEEKVVKLGERLKSNVFCDRMLRQLLVNHFYLFPTSESTKQKICDKLGIPIVKLRTIDLDAKHAKKFDEPVSRKN